MPETTGMPTEDESRQAGRVGEFSGDGGFSLAMVIEMKAYASNAYGEGGIAI